MPEKCLVLWHLPAPPVREADRNSAGGTGQKVQIAGVVLRADLSNNDITQSKGIPNDEIDAVKCFKGQRKKFTDLYQLARHSSPEERSVRMVVE